MGRQEFVLRAALASAVFAAVFAPSSRADAHFVSCNLRIPCPFDTPHYSRGRSRAIGYASCNCGFGNTDGTNRTCVPVTSCNTEGGRCRGSCPAQPVSRSTSPSFGVLF
jgi:hypothetical protein